MATSDLFVTQFDQYYNRKFVSRTPSIENFMERTFWLKLTIFRILNRHVLSHLGQPTRLFIFYLVFPINCKNTFKKRKKT